MKKSGKTMSILCICICAVVFIFILLRACSILQYRFLESAGSAWTIVVIGAALLASAVSVFICTTTLKDGAKKYSILCTVIVLLVVLPLFSVTFSPFSQNFSSHTILCENCGIFDKNAMKFAENNGFSAYLGFLSDMEDGTVTSYDYTYRRTPIEKLSVSADIVFDSKHAFNAAIEKLVDIESAADYYGSRVDCELDVEGCSLKIKIESPAG